MNRQAQIPIIEIFGPTIQGEGAIAGKVSHFIRSGGCGYKCSWCDSMHAVDPVAVKANAKWMFPGEIVDRVIELPRAEWVTFTGGDPVMWDFEPAVLRLMHNNMKITVETQGQLFKHWLTLCDQVTVSPKPPSSGMSDKTNMQMLHKYETVLNKRMSLKVVVFDEKDLHFAINLHDEFPHLPLYLSAGTNQGQDDETTKDIVLHRTTWLAEQVLKRPSLYNVSVFPQLHVLLWGTKQGV